MLNRDIIIIGAGHNGLVAAYYLAKAGFKPLVLERRDIIGGACTTEEFHAGFRASLASSAGPPSSQIVNDLQLHRYGLEVIQPQVRAAAMNLMDPPMCIEDDAKRTADEPAAHSKGRSETYSEF